MDKFKNMNNKSIYIYDDDNNLLYKFNKDDVLMKPKDGSNSIIDLAVIRKISTDLLTLNKQIKNMNKILWDKTIKEIYTKYRRMLTSINEFIAEVDFYSSGAYLSITNNYHRPKTDPSADKAFIQATEIRHPIIESSLIKNLLETVSLLVKKVKMVFCYMG